MLVREARLFMTEAKPVVMVVHDDAALRDALQFALRLEGSEVRAHETAGALLEDQRLADCICLVLKYHLPDIDGLALLGRVRAMGFDMPAILLTSSASPALRARAKAAGVWLVLEKPIMDAKLVDAVATLLREIT